MKQIIFAIIIFMVFTGERSNKWWGNTVEKANPETSQTASVEDPDFVAKSNQDDESLWYSDDDEEMVTTAQTTSNAATSAVETESAKPAPAAPVDPVQTQESLKRFAEALKKLADQKRLEQKKLESGDNELPTIQTTGP